MTNGSPSDSIRAPLPSKSEAKSPPDTQQKSNKKKKKKRVSKHVIQALKDKEEMKLQLQKLQQEQPLANPSSQSTKQKKKKVNKIAKDPSEAAQYLTTWNENRNKWKFNKNTQSWLIRHMYESDKINKNIFTLLLKYLKGLPGGSTKTRIVAEATRRAFRYKEYEKSSQQQSAEKDEQGKHQKEAGARDNNNENTVSEGDDDATRWKALSEHEKRKEYKRARKLLETLKD